MTYSPQEKQIIFAASFLQRFSAISTQLKDAPKTPAFPPFLQIVKTITIATFSHFDFLNFYYPPNPKRFCRFN